MLHTRPKGLTGVDPAACVDQVHRVAGSSLLQSAEALCRLMRYLAEHSLHHPRVHLKEYQIATEVLGRSPDFDPHSDSSVRVQIGRLRNKLAEYYASEGSADPILIDIPKGRYMLSFQARESAPQPASVIELLPPPDPASMAVVRPTGFLRRRSLALAFAAAVVIAVLVGVVGHPVVSSVLAKRKIPQPPTALEIFWAPFLHGSSEPFVVFRNSSFIGDAGTGMRRFDPARDNPNQLVEHYTGIGEVMGVLEVDQLFGRFGSHFRVKRGSLFTVDDARDNNLIFVGAPGSSINLNEIPATDEFTFRRIDEGERRYKMAIIDNHPGSAAHGVYAVTPGVHPANVQYALVALKKGLDPLHWTLFHEGTSTVSTEAAVDFVCSETSTSDLLAHLHVPPTGTLRPFEALLRVKIANDVPLETQLLELRPTDH
jgi:hypothetical protein